MPNAVLVSRSDEDGSYIVPKEDLSIILSEFDDLEYEEPGTMITLRVVKIDQEQLDSLPDWEGW